MELDLDDPPAPLARLLESGEETGCVNLSELDQIARRLEVDEDDLHDLHEAFELRGIDVTDDCGRSNVAGDGLPQRRHGGRHDRRARPVSQRDPPPPAADRGGGGRALQAHRAGRPGGQGADDQLQPRARRLDRQEVPAERAAAARPHPGGHLRPHPRDREVRLAARVQVLHVRDVLDPPGDPARHREQGAHDPRADEHRPARAQDPAHAPRAGRQARPRPDRRGDRRGRRAAARAGRRDGRPHAHRDEPRPAGRRGGRHGARRPARRRARRARPRRSRSRCATTRCSAPSTSCPSRSATSSRCATASTAPTGRSASARRPGGWASPSPRSASSRSARWSASPGCARSRRCARPRSHRSAIAAHGSVRSAMSCRSTAAFS